MFDFENIVQATTVDEAVSALVADPEALIIAGGSDVLIQIREGKHAGCRLVSIHGIPELSGITMDANGDILIGPLCTFAEVTESDIIQKHIPTLGFATDQAGGPQLRNIGTIGGNICNGVTSADSAATLLTLNSQLELTGQGGRRTTPQETFYAGPSRVHKEHDEVLTCVRIAKKDYDGFYGHYIKFAQRNAMDIATLGCAVHVKVDAAGTRIEELRLAFGVASATPIRCHATEEKVAGAEINDALFDLVAEGALSETNPRDSWRASKAFRQQLIYELPRRALREALIKAGAAL